MVEPVETSPDARDTPDLDSLDQREMAPDLRFCALSKPMQIFSPLLLRGSRPRRTVTTTSSNHTGVVFHI